MIAAGDVRALGRRHRQRERQRYDRRAFRPRKSSASAASRTNPSAEPRAAKTGIVQKSRRRCQPERQRPPLRGQDLGRSAAITNENDVPERPKPIIAPAEMSSIGARSSAPSSPVRSHTGSRRGRSPGPGRNDRRRRRRTVGRAPQQILQRQREREHVAAPVIGIRQRCQKKAERRPRAKRIAAIRQPQAMTTTGVCQATDRGRFGAPLTSRSSLLMKALKSCKAGYHKAAAQQAKPEEGGNQRIAAPALAQSFADAPVLMIERALADKRALGEDRAVDVDRVPGVGRVLGGCAPRARRCCNRRRAARRPGCRSPSPTRSGPSRSRPASHARRRSAGSRWQRLRRYRHRPLAPCLQRLRAGASPGPVPRSARPNRPPTRAGDRKYGRRACTASPSREPSSDAPKRRDNAWRDRLRRARSCRRACPWRCAWPVPTYPARRRG